jgi:hypothetical protein
MQKEKFILLKQINWDYNIQTEDIEAVFDGRRQSAGPFTKESIFKRIIESYSWFTVLKIYSPLEIKKLLTSQIINSLRTPSLRKKYEIVRERLQEIIPAAG